MLMLAVWGVADAGRAHAAATPDDRKFSVGPGLAGIGLPDDLQISAPDDHGYTSTLNVVRIGQSRIDGVNEMDIATNHDLETRFPCFHTRLRGNRALRDPKRAVCPVSPFKVLFYAGRGTDGQPVTDIVKTDETSTGRVPVSIPMDFHLENGTDFAEGGSQGDELNGGPGDDVIVGRGGPDQLFGFENPWLIHEINERFYISDLEGQRDRDSLYGGQGGDLIWGGPDDDPALVGGAGRDDICGGMAAPHNLVVPTGCLADLTDAMSTADMEISADEHDGNDIFYSDESRERDLQTGLPSPTAPTPDTVRCSGGTANSTQYDAGDTLIGCPSQATAVPHPPVFGGTYLVPFQIDPRFRPLSRAP